MPDSETYQTGAIAELSTTWRVRGLVGVYRGSLIAVGVLATLPITLMVEGLREGSDRAVVIRAAIALGLVFVAWGVRGLVACCLRRRVDAIGSFFYVVGHQDISNDRLRTPYDRAMEHYDENIAVGSRTPVVHEVVSIDPSVLTARAARARLITNYSQAARRDSRSTPTNLLVNTEWHLGVMLGVRIAQDHRNARDEHPHIPDIRVWHVPDVADQDVADQPASLFGGAMIDLCTLPVRALSTHRTPTRDSDAVVIARCTDQHHLDDETRPLEKATEWGIETATQYRIDRKGRHKPKQMADIAKEVAAQIADALAGCTGTVVVFALLPRPVAFLVGAHLGLTFDAEDLERRLWFAGYEQASRSFELIRYDTTAAPVAVPIDASLHNLTAHPITVFDTENHVVFEIPAGSVQARVAEGRSNQQHLRLDGTTVPLTEITQNHVVGIPSPKAGVLFVVSRLTALASPERSDLIFPLDEVRDEHSGSVLGCRGFGRVIAANRGG